ncbi:MAG: nickel pincer cofactor biosynthesis protein LarC [Acidimicrobiia bacterium]
MAIAWFHCFSGAAGDMLLASLVDAGAPLDDIVAVLSTLPVDGWTIAARRVERGGITATHLDVQAHEHAHRSLADIVAIIDGASLPSRAASRATATFTRLAAVEAEIHGVAIDEVHFHEVGAVDAIVDIVGVCVALEVLDVDAMYASPIAVGTGTVRATHGLLPNPAPATVRLLAGVAAPTYGLDIPIELTTPTGAALLAANVIAFGPMPAMAMTSTGFGAGTKDFPQRSNVVQVVVGATRTQARATEATSVVELATNVDDVTGEVLAATVALLLERGALDAWLTPIVMKKGRPAFTVHVLAADADVRELTALLMAETGTLGVRTRAWSRTVAERRVETVTVDGVEIGIKVGPYRAKAEFDDAVAASRRLGRPLREIIAVAEQRWNEQNR